MNMTLLQILATQSLKDINIYICKVPFGNHNKSLAPDLNEYLHDL